MSTKRALSLSSFFLHSSAHLYCLEAPTSILRVPVYQVKRERLQDRASCSLINSFSERRRNLVLVHCFPIGVVCSGLGIVGISLYIHSSFIRQSWRSRGQVRIIEGKGTGEKERERGGRTRLAHACTSLCNLLSLFPNERAALSK